MNDEFEIWLSLMGGDAGRGPGTGLQKKFMLEWQEIKF